MAMDKYLLLLDLYLFSGKRTFKRAEAPWSVLLATS